MSRRPSTTASPGSTSYEGADKEPFEPGWSGATWYGASSGTYWTINPKEYADPRKHGPEYQARARRARAGDTIDDPAEALDASEPSTAADPAAGPDSAEPFSGGAAADASAPDGPDGNPARPASRPASADPPGGRRPSGRPSGRRGGTAATGSRRTADAGAGRPGAAAAAGLDGAPWTGSRFARPARSPGGDAGHGAPPINGLRVRIEQPADDRGFRGPLLRRPTTPAGRFAMALLGWPPLGAFAAATIDQSTGCGRYAASCPEISAPGTWILEVAIVFLLFALPSLAAWSAHGTIATLVVGVPSAIILSAAGGTNVREASAPILLGVLAVAYLAGVAYAVIVGRRPARV